MKNIAIRKKSQKQLQKPALVFIITKYKTYKAHTYFCFYVLYFIS